MRRLQYVPRLSGCQLGTTLHENGVGLFGGGELFRSLLAAGLVDGVEVSVVPVLLGGGIPFPPSPANRATLRLCKQRLYERTGTVGLEYDVSRS
jgi:dihydrofolate reductase